MKENLLQAVIDRAADSIIVIDASTQEIVFANKRFCEKLGYCDNEVKGLKISELQAYPYGPEEWKDMVALLKNKNLVRQNTYVSKEGKRIPVEIIGSYLVCDGKGYVSATIHNLGERNEKQDRLVESEKFFRAIAENATEGVSIFNADGIILYANNAFQLILGYNVGEMIGESILEIVHPFEAAEVKERLRQLVAAPGTSLNTAYRYKTKAGEWAILESSSVNLLHHPAIRGVLNHFHDVTEKLNAQQKVKLHERYLGHIVNAIPTPVWTKNWNGEITIHNHAFTEMYSQPLNKLLETGDDASRNDKGLETEYVEADRKIMIACEPTPFYEASFEEPATKEKRYLQMRKVPVIIEPDKFELVCVALDITEHKQAEEELRKKNEALLKVNMELDRFIYSASHELRAPLTSALGILNFIKTDTDGKDLDKHIRFLDRSIGEMEVLVRRLSQFSANERGLVTINEIDIEKLLAKVIEDVSSGVTSTIELRQRVQRSGKFYSDEARIYILLKNLLENAIKYKDNKKDGPFIQVLANVDAQGAYFEITDNGIGIPEKYLGRVFNLFSRATSVADGAGLGLYIVKEIVNKLKGTIQVRSLEGQGSSFMVTLPSLKE